MFSFIFKANHVGSLLQPLDLASGTLFRSSCAIQTSPYGLFRRQMKGHLFRKA